MKAPAIAPTNRLGGGGTMPYPKTNQSKTGFPREDSPNRVKRFGGKTGQEGGQKKTGHLSETSAPTGQNRQGELPKGQKSKGVSSEISRNPGNHAQSGRVDKIEEIG
jgi:hypothetical protein